MTMLPDTLPIADPPSARLVGTFGYRVEGDTACLNAEIEWLNNAADQGHWRLQLWARPLGTAAVPALVAELPVTVPLHTHGEPFYVEGYVMALPPAGPGAHEMTLRLVATGPQGAPVLHDGAAFAQPERFVQPRLEGARLTQGVSDALALVVERVHNPRPADNLSGSLALELWALAEPYRGGPFNGRCITSLQLDALPGQAEAGPLVLSVPAHPADHKRPWCLMLREWTSVGYVTRDYTALVPPVPAVARAPAAAPSHATTARPPAATTPIAVPPARTEAPRTATPAPASAYMPPSGGARPLPTVPRPLHRAPAGPAVPAGLGSRLIANLRQFLQR